MGALPPLPPLPPWVAFFVSTDAMALQFFAVHSEALAHTHDALQAHAMAQGERTPGPTRALRIAQLYGHLQLRAAGREQFAIALCELAASWRLQPRQLRQDLALLQALGWLSATGTTRGTVISLKEPTAPEPAELAEREASQRPPEAPAGRVEPAERDLQPGVPRKRPQGRLRLMAADTATARRQVGSGSLPELEPTEPPTLARENVISVATATKRRSSSAKDTPAGDSQLLQRLTELYNTHRPPSWPAYHPRGQGLRAKVRQALRQAGGPDALAATLIAALQGMPAFWRTTYPQGRSGAECFAVLFSTDRGCAGLGVEFWHLFTWAQEHTAQPSGEPTGVATKPAPEDPLQKAQRLFLWDSGVWRAQGREALLLSIHEKRELALLLEAHGQGIPGTAERQFAEAEPSPPEPPEQPPAAVSAQVHRPRPGLWRLLPPKSAPGAPTVIVHRSPRQPRQPGHTQPQASGSQAS